MLDDRPVAARRAVPQPQPGFRPRCQPLPHRHHPTPRPVRKPQPVQCLAHLALGAEPAPTDPVALTRHLPGKIQRVVPGTMPRLAGPGAAAKGPPGIRVPTTTARRPRHPPRARSSMSVSGKPCSSRLQRVDAQCRSPSSSRRDGLLAAARMEIADTLNGRPAGRTSSHIRIGCRTGRSGI